MIKKLNTAVLFLIHILFLQVVYCQVPENMPDYLGKRFINYTSLIPREELYIHSDRGEYISGEDLWFNIYSFDRQSLKPSFYSKIAYFELLNPENRPVVQKRIWLNEGCGQGQIVLPDTLSTGGYIIRAYTSWMKNFLPYNCFSKEVYIYNAFNNKTLKGKVNSAKIITGGVRDNNNEGALNAGVSLKVDNLKPDILEIIVLADKKYRSENNDQFYLFIQTHGTINRVSSERITDETTRILIPKSQLSAGINQITLFNLKGQPVGERLVYTPDKEIRKISVHSADSSQLRNKMSVEIEFGSATAKISNSSNLSISVSPATNNHSVMDINDYMIFGTEFGMIPGNIFKNGKVDETAPEVIDSLLRTLKSNWINWQTILADQLPVYKYPVENEDHYLSGKLINNDQKTADPDQFVLMSHPSKTAGFQYTKTDKEGNFTFRVHIDDKVNDLIIQPDITSKNQTVSIESPFSDQYIKSEISVDSTTKPVPDYISTWSVNNQVRKIYGTSYTGEPLKRSFSQYNIKRFYGKPDQELVMKDYITLPVMQEVFFELLVGVFLKSKKSGYEITIADPENNKPYDIPPGLFVDGVMIKDPSLIAGIDPEVVEKIEVIKQKYLVGDYLFYGLVNIITKAGDFSNVVQPNSTIRLHYKVLDPVVSFVSPDYSSAVMKKRRIPDFRNTLYWNPSVKPDKEGKARVDFWTSDFVSDFEVNIQGVTPDGKPFSTKKIIKVRK